MQVLKKFKILIIVLFMLLLLTSCNTNKLGTIVPKDAKAGDLILESFKLKIDKQIYNAEHGTLVVPENWNNDSSKLISLPVLIIHSVDSKPIEPIFYLGGGPGASNMSFKPPHFLLINHDVVLVGYRGADGSMIFDLPEVKKAIKGVGNDLLSKESVINLSRAFDNSFKKLIEKGVDLNCYTMLDVIMDMEAARKALKYDKINLLSDSYGTRVAQIYAYRHPESIFRSVMIGVNTPGGFVWEPDIIDNQIRYYAKLWAKDPECLKLSSDLTKTVHNMSYNMPSHWLFLPINQGKVRTIIFGMFSSRKTAAMAFDALLAAEKGDPSGLALMSIAYNLMVPSSSIWGDLATKAISADFDPDRDYFSEMEPPDAILGAADSKLVWGCTQFFTKLPIKSIPEEFRKVQNSDVETLLISGSVDFSTPAENATKKLLPELSHGKQIIFSEMGHCGDLWSLQPKAFELLLTSFYNTGIADESLVSYLPMDFHVSLGFPEIAKILLLISFVILVALFTLVFFIVRRIKKHKNKI
ncbi:MAG TPA: alpha/beta fold hydrolase [Caldisericia bacterium]|nr:alpha/beta fold hydrolase [Caldisericia bacterium]